MDPKKLRRHSDKAAGRKIDGFFQFLAEEADLFVLQA
jgi:hypothetical protein